MKFRKLFTLCLTAGLASGAFSAEVATPLVAGQNTVIGEVACVLNASGTGACAFDITSAGWCLTETHLYVGAALPRRAAPGQFPYHTSGGCRTEVIVPFTLAGAGLSACPASGTLAVMAHAVAVNSTKRQTETAWGSGARTGLGGWSMSFNLPCVLSDSPD